MLVLFCHGGITHALSRFLLTPTTPLSLSRDHREFISSLPPPEEQIHTTTHTPHKHTTNHSASLSNKQLQQRRMTSPSPSSPSTPAPPLPPPPPPPHTTDPGTHIQEHLDKLALACFNAVLEVSKVTGREIAATTTTSMMGSAVGSGGAGGGGGKAGEEARAKVSECVWRGVRVSVCALLGWDVWERREGEARALDLYLQPLPSCILSLCQYLSLMHMHMTTTHTYPSPLLPHSGITNGLGDWQVDWGARGSY